MKEIKSKQTDSVKNVNYKFQFKYFSKQIVAAKQNLLLRHYRTDPITTGFRKMTLRFANQCATTTPVRHFFPLFITYSILGRRMQASYSFIDEKINLRICNTEIWINVSTENKGF